MPLRPFQRTIAAGALLLAAALPARSGELLVAAAASLSDVLQEIGSSYEKATGEKVVFNFAGSTLLARQIQEGAPADLFFSADEASMDRLDRAGLLVAGTRTNLLRNRLAVIVPADGRFAPAKPADLASGNIESLALGDPQTVPAGVYAKEYLEKAGVWDAVRAKVIPTDNVRAALAAVATGNADAGIVYVTDARGSKSVRTAWEVPAIEGPRIVYPAAVVASSNRRDAAAKFLEYLASSPVKEIFRTYGFEPL